MSSTQSQRTPSRRLVRSRESLVVPERGPLRLEWWSARKPILIAYVAPAFVVALLVNTWYRAGTFIAGSDTPPFIRTSMVAELGSMWGYSVSGAGSPSFRPAASMPELIMVGAMRLVGWSDQTGQRLFHIAAVIALVVSATFFVRAFVSRPWVGAVAGLLAFFNPFVLQTKHGIHPLVATAMMAAVGGLVLRAAKGQNVSAFALAGVLAISGYVALSPPLLAVAAVWTVALAALGSAFFGAGGTRRAVGLLVRTAPWALLLNLWWIVPYITTLLTTSSTDILSPKGVFTRDHTRLNVANVVSLAGHWGWSRPGVIPYAASLERLPWALLKFGLPLLALLAAVTVRGNRIRAVLVLIGVAVVLLFLGKGLHEPLGSVNAFLYRHVPGMSLLRNPFSKVAPILLLAYVALAAMALDHAFARWGSSKPIRRLIPWSMLALAGAALAFPTPLWTGEVIPDDESPGIFSRYIRIPEAWFSVATFVNALPQTGKVLVLPVANRYQAPTTWGYSGVDVIPRYLLKQPTMQVRRGAWFNERPPFRSLLVKTVQSSLVAGDTAKAIAGLHAVGAKYVIVRHDIPPRLSPALGVPYHIRVNQDYRPILASLRASPQATLLKDSAVATVFEVRGKNAGFIGTGESSNRRVRWRRVGASKYEVQVPATRTGLVLELREAFDRRWRLEGVPDGRLLQHVIAHGYANAWRIPPGAGFQARISYGPDRFYYAAIAISAITALTALALVVMRRRRSAVRDTGAALNGPSRHDPDAESKKLPGSTIP